MTLLLVVLLTLAILLVIFSIYNPVSVEIAFPLLADSLVVPAPLLVAMAASISAICIGGVGLWFIVSLRVRIHNAETRARKAESDLALARQEIDALMGDPPEPDPDSTPDPGPRAGDEPDEDPGSGDQALDRDS